MSSVLSVTAIAPVNIATIKYWGKRDETLVLPLNDSVSATLSSQYMRAETTVAISPLFENDQIWLNGKEESIENPRLQNCLTNIKKASKISPQKLAWKIRICSKNNFPTAAGLASSAAGYACLVFALSKLYNVDENISAIARQGSGSACRSVFGGFVWWQAGVQKDGSDSIATQIVPASHWPELRILILVANDAKKKTGSTPAMRRTAKTSELLQHRITHSVPKRTSDMIEAIKRKNFQTFAEITMRDSNQFHAVCLDSYPPLAYLNDTSHAVMSFVHEYNAATESNTIAYTFDAGPNACLFTLEKDVPAVLATIMQTFPSTRPTKDYVVGMPIDILNTGMNLPGVVAMEADLFKFIISTKLGEGPELLPYEASLLDSSGAPLNLSE